MWPFLLAVSGLAAVLQFVTLLFFPEAPRYLYIDKGDTEGTKKGEWNTVDSSPAYNTGLKSLQKYFASLEFSQWR